VSALVWIWLVGAAFFSIAVGATHATSDTTDEQVDAAIVRAVLWPFVFLALLGGAVRILRGGK
jgi:hypothetical protein